MKVSDKMYPNNYYKNMGYRGTTINKVTQKP